MSLPTIPPDAPFDAEQRRFVEGFLAALLSVRAAQQAATVPVNEVEGASLLVLYGSQSGNCEALSKQIRKLGRTRGFSPEVASLDGFDRERLPEVERLLILCSTFGEGDPPDNAKSFYDWILSDDAPALSALSYSVCALGDVNYTHFCKAGFDIDRRLAELGATRLADCVQCDVGYDEDFAAWHDAVFDSEPMIEAAADVPVSAHEEADEVAPAWGVWDKHNPFAATLLRVRNLNAHGSAKEVNHVEISLAGSGLEYEVGDALGVWPTNCGAHVEELLDAGGFTGEEVVSLKGEAFPLRAVLLTRLDLCVLTPAVRERLDLPVEADWLRDRHLIDLLVELASRVDAQTLCDVLRPLQPRLYSIASSPKAHPGQVHLTVGAVRYEMHGRSRKGIASTFLADRCGSGSTVRVYVQHTPHFRLPDDDITPIIMVGPGTGVAPFRAFLGERAARHAPGRAWLFFGDQHEQSDFLYREQLTGWRNDGVLSRLDLAWSRDAADKVYVQHRMIERGRELWRWLEDGAHFYVCGDAGRMASDVDAALHALIGEHGHMTDDEAAHYVKRLTREHRYQRDVY